MKVLFAHDHRFVRVGGLFHSRGSFPEGVLARYAEFFGAVDVICRVDEEIHTNLPAINRPDIVFHPQRNIRSLIGLKSFRAVNRNVSKLVSDSDAVVARLPSTLGWITAREARLQGVPCLIEVVGNALETSQLHGSWLGKIVGYFEHGLSRFEIRKAKTVVYITENYLQSVYPTDGRSFVCPNVRVIRISESQMAEHQRARPRTTNPRIGLIGSLNVNYKGHDVAIDVLKLLLERYNLNGATLEFAGGGDPARWQELARQKNVQNQVRIHGAIAAGEAIMRWIDEMDILLQPSLTEGQGRAIIEAMSRGRPVVASNAGGIPELLDGDWMAEPKDVDRIAERCALLLSEPATYQSVSWRNWRKAGQFDLNTVESVRRDAFRILRDEFENRDCGNRQRNLCV